MAIRIVGVDIPQNKCGEVSLTYIYGIGRSSAKKILAEAGIDPSIKVENWTDDQAAKVREIIGAKFKVEGDLRSETQLNIKRLMDIGCYRGVTPARARDVKRLLQTKRRQQSKLVVNNQQIIYQLWQRKLLQLRSA